mgnify:CR=1 FL=1
MAKFGQLFFQEGAHFGESAQLKRRMPHSVGGEKADKRILHQVFDMDRCDLSFL